MFRRVILLIVSGVAVFTAARAQDADTLRGMYRTYTVPAAGVDSPVPKGYKPVYISHYGRHGSRYHLSRTIVARPLDSLRAAQGRGVLTRTGAELLRHLEQLYAASDGRWMELTAVGAAEHRGIADRMQRRFAPVFKGRRQVEAYSTIRTRCILSMRAAISVLSAQAPSLRYDMHSGPEYTRYLKNEDLMEETQAVYNPLIDSLTAATHPWEDCVRRLVTDYRGDRMDALRYVQRFWHCWAEAPCTGIRDFDLLGWLTWDELRDLDRWMDMHLCMKCLRTDRFGERRVATQDVLLQDIISKADAALADGKTAATLRYGHDANLVPLMGLMHVEGFSDVYVLRDVPDPRWNSARMIPMGSNLQMVFYRRGKKDPVLVKILYNEKERLVEGLAPVSGPYYDWSALKRFWVVQGPSGV